MRAWDPQTPYVHTALFGSCFSPLNSNSYAFRYIILMVSRFLSCHYLSYTLIILINFYGIWNGLRIVPFVTPDAPKNNAMMITVMKLRINLLPVCACACSRLPVLRPTMLISSIIAYKTSHSVPFTKSFSLHNIFLFRSTISQVIRIPFIGGAFDSRHKPRTSEHTLDALTFTLGSCTQCPRFYLRLLRR